MASIPTYASPVAGLSMADAVRLAPTGTRNTKVVCTMGPACWDVETLSKMMTIGMNVCRLNFSHGDHAAHGNTLGRIREAATATGKKIAVMLDTKGPEIRTGFFADPSQKIQLTAGQTLRIVTDYDFKGDSSCIACTYKALPTSVQPGYTILIADGSLVCTVLECGPDFVDCRVENNAAIGERKNMNLPGVKVDLPVLQPKDVDDIQNFGIPQGVDLVAASFVQSAADVQFIRDTLGEAGAGIKIIAKIENQEGLENFDEILAAVDGIMVARGDLGMEIPPEKVFIAQKMMIAKCNAVGKPVITATQMLESMCGAPRPTRAEASDVANAVLDGTDAVMLSGETAGGGFPLEAVTCMVNTCREAEKTIDYQTALNQSRALSTAACPTHAAFDAAAAAAAQLSLDAAAKAIVVVTDDEKVVQAVNKFRPACPVVLATSNEQLARQATGYFKNVQATVAGDAAAACAATGLAVAGDCIVTFTDAAAVSLVTL